MFLNILFIRLLKLKIMALITLRQLLDHAAENNYGVPAFNVNNLEQIRAIMEGANELDSPVIVQASAGARKYAGPKFIKSMMEAAIEEFPNIPIVMHQDHGGSNDDCKVCIDLGFSSVMRDGSLLEDQKTPSDFDFNVVIRSILYNSTKRYLSVMAGGAITNKSIPKDEYEECLVKIKTILEIASGEKERAI